MRLRRLKIRSIDSVNKQKIFLWNQVMDSLGGADSLPIEYRFKLEIKARTQLVSSKVDFT
tara:strand:+ start:838 stop:1017 length:180 start_codon:yes stop_codon:yes gene_type:complete